MDNLTHSLIGALIGQTGLKKLSGLGMPTLIIAANIPDIDAACFLWLEGTEHLGFRRGITHGPLAMLILPLLLTAAMVGFDRWQARRGTRPVGRAAVRFGPLFVLALIGTLSHPAFDWLNNYGVRLLEPFSSRWFYGDSIFIIDVWMWVILIGGLIWSRLAEKRGGDWARRGQATATIIGLYVLANGLITGAAESDAARLIAKHSNFTPDLVVANPVPFAFWRRDIEWRHSSAPHLRGTVLYGSGDYEIFGGSRLFRLRGEPIAPSNRGRYLVWDTPVGDNFFQRHREVRVPEIERMRQAARTDPQVRAFLFWSRMPLAELEPDWSITLRDQRFTNPLTGDRFKVRIAPETQDSSPQPRSP